MYYMVLLVLHEIEKVNEVLVAWEEAGVSGVTVIPTVGLGRIRHKFALRDDLPLIPSLEDLLADQHEELHNRTMFSIVENETLVDRLIAATEQVLGDMNRPQTGIIAVLPLARVQGLSYSWKTKKKNENSSS